MLRARLGMIVRMAWRDSRASRSRLLLFALCNAIGIAALVAVGSFGHSLEAAIEAQSKALLGADLSIGSRVRFTADHEAFLASIGGTQSREISFSTMLVFPATGDTRLVQVRALEGDFPFYGRIETQPPAAVSEFREPGGGGVLVEESLLLQFNARVGDPVRIGRWTTRIVGSLHNVPGESIAFATISPRVYLSMEHLQATGLLESGSLARYRALFRLPPSMEVSEFIQAHRSRINELRLSVTTVEERKEDLGQAMQNLYHFLNLVGFIALLLGGVGVASAIQVHVKQKVPTVAILRCLGCPVWAAFGIYLLQATAVGIVGAVIGAAVGNLIQYALPGVVADFVPFEVPVKTSWSAVGEAALLGFVICVLFALLPLSAVRRVSPLEVLRVAFEPTRRRDPLQALVGVALLAVIVLFALGHTRRWQEGLGFAAGLIVAFALLAGMARVAILAARNLRVSAWPFVVRQGLASVHRPNNRTLLLVSALGLGTFLLLTLHLTHTTLLRELFSSRTADRANAILFDIQPDQEEAVSALLQSQGRPILDRAPIVTMRLKSIRGRAVEQLLEEKVDDSGPPRWALRREFRSTFTDQLRDSETLTEGEWIGRVPGDMEIVPISVENGIARELGVGLEDELEWDIQGVPMRTRVASLREVDWRRVQPNFFVLFPLGPLDEAPSTRVLVTHVESPEESARLQRAVVQQFSNVSVIDITLVLQTLDQILGKIGFVIRFMAFFTVATGLVVLVAAVLSGRYQRMRESVLLRILGASRRQVFSVLLVEYAVLGITAAATGVVLALGGAAALAWFVFKVPFSPPLLAPLVAVFVVTAITLITGFAAHRSSQDWRLTSLE